MTQDDKFAVSELAVGDMIQLQNLKFDTTLNGRYGRVIGRRQRDGAVYVDLGGDGVVPTAPSNILVRGNKYLPDLNELHAANLVPAPEQVPAPGQYQQRPQYIQHQPRQQHYTGQVPAPHTTPYAPPNAGIASVAVSAPRVKGTVPLAGEVVV